MYIRVSQVYIDCNNNSLLEYHLSITRLTADNNISCSQKMRKKTTTLKHNVLFPGIVQNNIQMLKRHQNRYDREICEFKIMDNNIYNKTIESSLYMYRLLCRRLTIQATVVYGCVTGLYSYLEIQNNTKCHNRSI